MRKMQAKKVAVASLDEAGVATAKVDEGLVVRDTVVAVVVTVTVAGPMAVEVVGVVVLVESTICGMLYVGGHDGEA
ncbi:MAG: hypothetical protein SGPRY_006032 [Prymnesium sp.]